MSETTNDTTTPTNAQTPDPSATSTSSDSTDRPLGDNGEKALRAERLARASAERSAAALQKQLDDINAANLSDLERAQKVAADAEAATKVAATEALRLRAAAKHGISEEDADLFLTGSDAETVERQAIALKARTSNGPKPDLSQGAKGGTSGAAGGTPEQDFANFLGSALNRG